MLRLDDYKLIFISVGLIGILVLASPTLGLVLRLPGGERFSELWILGSGGMAEGYPTNVYGNGSSYMVNVGVGNHMGSSIYYVVYVKFRNETDAFPNDTSGEPSPLLPLYEYDVFIEDGENWTAPLAFSVSNVSFSGNSSLVGTLTINGVPFNVSKPVSWNMENSGFYYELLVELWIYNSGSDAIQFHDRFVGFYLNMTRSV
jgi:hypothetical protein